MHKGHPNVEEDTSRKRIFELACKGLQQITPS